MVVRIAIGSDHGGYELKLEVIKHLKDRGFEVTDYGCDSTASCDYPIYGKAVAEAVHEVEQDITDTTMNMDAEPAPTMPVDDNPNRTLSPEEIAALFASMQ